MPIDYSKYADEELVEAYSSINREEYADNFKRLTTEMEKRSMNLGLIDSGQYQISDAKYHGIEPEINASHLEIPLIEIVRAPFGDVFGIVIIFGLIFLFGILALLCNELFYFF